MHDFVLIRELEYKDYATHRLQSFTYGLQHPEIYLVSPKTYATNLLGVCIGIEYGNDQKLFNKLLRMFDSRKISVEKLSLPESFGDLNISHVTHAKNASEYRLLVEEWAKAVWKAYGAQHGLAHEWVKLL